VRIPEDDANLLDECTVETFRSSGPGGQNVNVRDTAVRRRHRPSGIVVTCQRERSQLRNKQIALQELCRRLEEAAKPVRPRIPTTVPRGARARSRQEKVERSQRKASRRKPSVDE